jgi:hypothetical protein
MKGKIAVLFCLLCALVLTLTWDFRQREEVPVSIAVVQPAVSNASWTVAYGQEFWRKRSVGPSNQLNLAEVMERVSHAFQEDKGSNSVHVVAQSYTATFDVEGARLAPRGDGSPEAFLQTRSITRGADTLKREFQPWSFHGNTAQRLLIASCGLVEHYEARQEGLELTWVLKEAPLGSGPLRVEVKIDGLVYHSSTTTGHHFADDNGVARMRIGSVTVVDAAGWRTEGTSEVRDDLLIVQVSDDVLTTAQFPLAIDPLISPEFGIDEPVPAIAFGQQYNPAVASNGRDYLVVWETWGPDFSLNIRGTRVRSSDGLVLDVGGLPISTAISQQNGPFVASDGTDYFVVWNDHRNQSSTDIYGTKVTSEGQVVHPEGLAIRSGPGNQSPQTIACNGSNYFVGWIDSSRIFGTLIDRDGGALSGDGFPIASSLPGRYGLSAASDGQNYLLAWTQPSTTVLDIYGARVSSTGQVLDPEGFPISTAPAIQEQPSVAGNSSGFLVAWTDTRNGQYDTFAARVNWSGQVLDPSGIGVYPGPGTQLQPAVAAAGDQFQIVFRDQDGPLKLARVSAEGELLDPNPLWLTTGQPDHYGPMLASSHEQTLIVWETASSGFYAGSDIFGLRISLDGLPYTPRAFPISLGVNLQNAPAVAHNGRNYLIVWQDGRGEQPWNIFGTRASADGTILDVNGLAISTAAGDQDFPTVASNGRDFFVVWRDARNIAVSGYDIYGCRVTGEGMVLDTNGLPLAVSPDWEEAPAIAGNENGYVLVWQSSLCCGTPLLAAHVSNEGVRAAEPAYLDQFGIRPAIASNGREFLAVWQGLRRPNDFWTIHGARFSSTGELMDLLPLPINMQAYDHLTPAIASDGRNYLVTWQGGLFSWQAPNIYGAFVSSEGVAAATFPIVLNPGTAQTAPDVVFDGRDYLVAWEDQRNSGRSGTDIYGAKVTTNGLVFPDGGFAINASAGNQLRPAAAALQGSVLSICQSPYGLDAVRLTANLITPGVAPPWRSQDVGATAVPGGADAAGRSFLVRGSGAGIGANADAFHYVFQPLSARVQIQARLARLDSGFAGLMIRESLDPGARHALFGISSNQFTFGWRAGGNGDTQTQSVPGYWPIWLRLLRYDNTVLALQSLDGSTWQRVGSITLALPNDVLVGLVVSSGSDSQLSTAWFEEVSVFPAPASVDEPVCPPRVQWEQSFGSIAADEGGQVRQLADGGFIVGGTAEPAYGPGGNKTAPEYGYRDFWLVRLDAAGRKIWDQSYGGMWDDVMASLQVMPDGGFILGGWSTSPASGNKTSPNFGESDFWVVRTDAAGNKLWDRSFGGSGSDTLTSLELASDGGLILAGGSSSPPDGNKSSPNYGLQDFWVVRLDAANNKLWDRSFGGAGREAFCSIKQTTDGGYILAGASDSAAGSGTKTSPNFGQEDYWVLRLDANGQRLWERSFGGSTVDEARSVLQTADGGFFVAGRSASVISGNKASELIGWYDYWLLRLDAAGTKLWEQTYGGEGVDDLQAMAPVSDGGLLLIGSSWSGPSGSKTSPAFGGLDFWLVRVSPTGTKLWDQSFGDENENHAQSAQNTGDRGFIVGGYTRYYDINVIKLLPENFGDCDNDGVPDAIDLCPDTPLGAVANQTGCSVIQLCPCESMNSQDEYITCVQTNASEFYRAGLITHAQQRDLIEQASNTECPPLFGEKRGIAFGLLHTSLDPGVLQFNGGEEWPGLGVRSREGYPYGVSVFLGEADSGLFIYPYTDFWGEYSSAWFLSAAAYGQMDGGGRDVPIATVRGRKPYYETYPVDVDLSPLEPQSLTFQVYSNKTLMAEATTLGATGTVTIYSSVNIGPRANPFWRWSDGSVGVIVEFMAIEVDPWARFSISGPFGENIRGDRIFIRANQPAKSAQYVSRVDILSSLPSFSIVDERLGMFAHAHQAVGPVLFHAAGGQLTIAPYSPSLSAYSIGTIIEASGRRLEVDLKPLALDIPESVFRINAGFIQATLTHGEGKLLLEGGAYSHTQEVEVFKNGSLVGTSVFSNIVATGTLSLKNNHVPQIIGCSIAIESNGVSSLSISFKELVEFTPPNGPSLRGNNVRIAGAPSEYVTEIWQVALQVTGIDSFTITGERSEPIPPPLGIASSKDKILLTWPDNTRLFAVEAAPSLTAPFTRLTNDVDFLDNRNIITLPADAGSRFFHLNSPR